MKVTVAIPALNEEGCIGGTVKEVTAFADEVLVVDGESTDDTVARAREAGARVVHDGGGGKGRAIRQASLDASGEIVVFFDADGSHCARDIPKLVEPIKKGDADHVSASRLLGGSSELHGGFDEFLRLAGSSFITACINARFGVVISDSQNGFRAMRTEFLRSLDLKSDSTTIEQELICRTIQAGGRLIELPSHEFPRKWGKSHINPLRDSYKYFYSLARLMIEGGKKS